jgi:hypothetical protein
MNEMNQQLTNNGILMAHGDIVATNVMVEHNHSTDEVRYSYTNKNGTRYGTMNFSSHITPMFDNSNRINGLLTNKPDPDNESYLFWENANN